MNETPPPSPYSSPSSAPSPLPSLSLSAPPSPGAESAIPGGFMLGVVLAVVGKVLSMLISASAMGSESPGDTIKTATYVALLQPIGVAVAAFALAGLALDRRTERTVAAAALLGAAVMVAAAI